MFVAALAAPVLLAVVLISHADRYVVRTEFPNAAGLRSGFNVTLGGVKVGTVTDVQLTKRDTALATLELQPAAAPVGRDAGASIQPSNLLGEKVVALAPGDLRHPAPSGSLIPANRTSTPVELDDVLDTLNSQTRLALATFFVEQGDALVGRTGDLAATLERLPPTLDDAHRLIAELGTGNRALGELIDRSDRILASSARERGSLGRFVDSAAGALDTLASRSAGLAATVRNTPDTLAQLRTSLAALERAAKPLIPAARGLRATAPALTSTLHELPPFAAAAKPTLAQLRAAAPDLQRLAGEATPVVRRLVPASQQLTAFARGSDSATKVLDQGIDDALGMGEGWARAIQGRDGIGHYFRLDIKFSPRVVTALMNEFVHPSTAQRREPGAHPGLLSPRAPASATRPHNAPAPKRQAPKLPHLPLPQLPHLPLPKLPLPLANLPVKDGGEAPVNKLLDYLLK
jgi:phospholipid/cholesterol/gamma-HCH transport system substrate-binding protein